MRNLMMAGRGLIIAWLAAIMLWLTPFAKAEIDFNSIVQGGVQYYIQTDKAVYDLGENVNILYRVSNLTNENITLGLVTDDPPVYYDFKVTQGDNQIWSYFYMSPILEHYDTPFTLGPLETKEFNTIWNMMNDNGTGWPRTDDFLVSPGMYNLIGEVDLLPLDQRVPISVSIDIIPEPTSMLFFGAGLIGLLSRNIRKPKN